ELRDFLSSSDYPLFGKPMDGARSVGSISIDRYDRGRDELVTRNGLSIPLAQFLAALQAHFASGYVFQKRLRPHATVREICGERVATVRVVTIIVHGQPEVFRACWKIPAGKHAADNFWRAGNLLAQVDLDTGRVLRVLRGTGPNLQELADHPDSGTRLLG